MTWKDDVATALINLGKESSLEEIYIQIESIRSNLGPNYKARVRATLEENSSDSEAWLGKDDLFRMVEKGTGIWDLSSNLKDVAKGSKFGINNIWWNKSEVFWVEVTDRDDIGENIWAPKFDTSGKKRIPSYSLVAMVKPGDIIFHYSRPRRQYIGHSVAKGYFYDDYEMWGSQGSDESRKNPFLREVFKVDLSNFSIFEQPIELDEVRKKTNEIFREIEKLKEEASGAIYAPFVYKNDQLEPPQGYLWKMPRNIAEMIGLIDKDENISSGVEKKFRPKTNIKRKSKRKTNAKKNKAIELRGMEFASNYFKSQGWEVEDTSSTTVDLTCIKDGIELLVEVKGTQKERNKAKITLTKNEVNLHKQEESNALVIVSEISVDETSGEPIASGGYGQILYNWSPEDENLIATQFEYYPQYLEFTEISEIEL